MVSQSGAPKGGAPKGGGLNPEKVGPRRVGALGWGAKGGAPKGGRTQNFAFFFPSPTPFLLFLSFSGGSRADGEFHTTTREPKRAHLRVPAFKNTTKIPREDPPEREEKNEFPAGERKKSAKFWAPNPSGPQPFVPHLFWGRAPTPPGPHQFGIGQIRPNEVGQMRPALAKCGIGQIRFGQMRPNKDGQIRFGQMRPRPPVLACEAPAA